MPLKQLRVCEPCNDRIHWAPCGKTCHLPVEITDRSDWRDNLQHAAGEMLKAVAP